MIEIEKVCVDFTAGRGIPTRAVDNVSLHIAAGEILALSVPAAQEKHSAAYPECLNASQSGARQHQRRGNFGAGRKSVTPGAAAYWYDFPAF